MKANPFFMARKKPKKQLRIEEELNFVPYITRLDEDTILYHMYGGSVQMARESKEITPDNVQPFLKLIDFTLNSGYFDGDEKVKAFKKKYPNH